MGVIAVLLQVVGFVVLVDAAATWMVGPDTLPRKLTRQLTEPLYRPIRAVLSPDALGVDLSPLIVIVICQGLARLLVGLA